MSKILYIVDNNDNTKYDYDIEEDTIIYHFSINSSSTVNINMKVENTTLYYYYNNINYDDNCFRIRINHLNSNTHSEVFNHGVNVNDKKLDYDVEGIVLKTTPKCICNQDNQIININNGKSTILPKLLIDNYDVDSNHAAYIGGFREDDLFYIMSRGISKKKAYKLLLNAFLINTDSIDRDKITRFVEEIEKI